MNAMWGKRSVRTWVLTALVALAAITLMVLTFIGHPNPFALLIVLGPLVVLMALSTGNDKQKGDKT